MNDRMNLKKISGLLAIATVIALVVHIGLMSVFNQRVNEVHGNDNSAATYMEIDARKDSTSTWVKRGYDLFGKTVDITGATIDGELHNTSSDTVSTWNLRINIKGDCLINQAWNGEVEIHQFVGTPDEVVQRLNLQNYKLEDVELKHLYDGDLLIPLQEGDYVLYFPNERFKEMPLPGNDSTKIGVIFYYLDSIDLSDYDLEFQYHRAFTQGPTFLVFALLLVLCFISALMYVVSDVTYRRAQTEMELRKSGISSLSDMYSSIYLIDLVTGDMTPVSVDGKSESLRPWSGGAKAFLGKICTDADDAYKGVVSEFVDIETLAERLKDRGSVVCEFVSKTYGWSCMRFFAMDHVEGQPVEKVICTVQDINEEKRELGQIEERVARAELETEAKNAFLANVSQEIQAPIREMLDLGGLIVAESGEGHIREYARDLCRSGAGLLAFADDILDYSEFEAGRLKLAPVEYSLKDLVLESTEGMIRNTRGRKIVFELDVSPLLPSVLRGDAPRLKQVMRNLITDAAEGIDGGSMKFSVFGKAHDGKAHLLVSVRTNGQGAHDVTCAGVAMRLVSGLLEIMGSELKVVQSGGDWHECYFEVEQEVVNETPVGPIALEGFDEFVPASS